MPGKNSCINLRTTKLYDFGQDEISSGEVEALRFELFPLQRDGGI